MEAYRQRLHEQAETQEFDWTLNHSPYLTRYEAARATAVAAQELANDRNPYIPGITTRSLGDEIKVGEMELYGGYLDDYSVMRKYPWSTPSERGGYCINIGCLKIKRR